MNPKTSPIALAPQYRKALRTYRPVVMYFGSPHCPACEFSGPIFRETAEAHKDRAEIYMLNTRESPRHPEVTGTPTVLFYVNGKLAQKLKGFGSKEMLKEVFARHIGRIRPKPVARKPRHDLPWLRQTLKTLCTAPRAYRINARKNATAKASANRPQGNTHRSSYRPRPTAGPASTRVF